MKTVYEFLGLLKEVKQPGENRWMALCPGHSDRKQSLSSLFGLFWDYFLSPEVCAVTSTEAG